jgi:hypothetical protein
MKNSTKSVLFMALLFVTACKRENISKNGADAPTAPSASGAYAAAQPGTATFTRFITIGDSQTAGYANDGLYNDGIINSPGAIVASKLKDVGMASFNQPFFSDAQKNGTGYLKLTGFSGGLPVLTRVSTQLGVRGSISIPGFGTVPLLTKYTGANDNYGVASLRVADITNPAFGNVNSYFERLLPGNSPSNNVSYIDYITAKPFDFFSLNLGSNDALYFTINGGIDLSRLTSISDFTTLYTQLVNRLTANGAKGVLSTIPSIPSLAFFNIIKVSSLVAQAKALNPAFDKLYISARKSSDESYLAYTTRVATDADLIPSTFDPTLIGKLVSTPQGMQPYGLSPYAPVDSKYILDYREITIAVYRISAYNTIIKNIAASKSLALFDAYSFFNRVKDGLVVQEIPFSAAYITGNLFSLDGAHLTPRGNALVAHNIIAAINTQYGSTIKAPVISSYAAN